MHDATYSTQELPEFDDDFTTTRQLLRYRYPHLYRLVSERFSKISIDSRETTRVRNHQQSTKKHTQRTPCLHLLIST